MSLQILTACSDESKGTDPGATTSPTETVVKIDPLPIDPISAIEATPILSTIQIQSDSLVIGGNALCSYKAENEVNPNALKIKWLLSETIDGTYVESAELNSGEAFSLVKEVAHKFLKCEIRYKDAQLGQSPSRALINSAPLISNSSIERVQAQDGSISYACKGSINDADGDELKTVYKWYKSRSGLLGPFSLLSGETKDLLPASSSLIGAHLVCEMTVSDGLSSVSPVKSPATRVENILPTDVSISLNEIMSTGAVQLGDVLSAKVGSSLHYLLNGNDAEASRLNYKVKIWQYTSVGSSDRSDVTSVVSANFFGATLQGGYIVPTAPVLSGSATQASYGINISGALAHKIFRLEAFAIDGDDGQSLVSKTSYIEVTNSSPLPFSVSILPRALAVYDLVFCDGATIDPDLDTLSQTSMWQVSDDIAGPYTDIGVPLPGGYTVGAEASRKFLRCSKTATDSRGASVVSSSSNALFVTGSIVDNFQATMFPATQTFVLQNAICSGDASDRDRGAVSYLSFWWSSPTESGPWTQYHPNDENDNLAITSALAHKFLYCRRRATDIDGIRTSTYSNPPLQVANTRPE
ncbi:MAG: hypothetical protein EOP06_02800, partial [Proteobacteria bacterium]